MSKRSVIRRPKRKPKKEKENEKEIKPIRESLKERIVKDRIKRTLQRKFIKFINSTVSGYDLYEFIRNSFYDFIEDYLYKVKDVDREKISNEIGTLFYEAYDEIIKYIARKYNKKLRINRKITDEDLKLVEALYNKFTREGYKINKKELFREAKGFFSNPLYPLYLFFMDYLRIIVTDVEEKHKEEIVKFLNNFLETYRELSMGRNNFILDYMGATHLNSKNKKVFAGYTPQEYRLTMLHELVHYVLAEIHSKYVTNEKYVETLALSIYKDVFPEEVREYTKKFFLRENGPFVVSAAKTVHNLKDPDLFIKYLLNEIKESEKTEN